MTDQPRKAKWGLKEWALLIGGLVLVPPVAGWLGKTAGEAASNEALPPTSTETPASFRAVASSQPADGVTDELMDQAFLANLEAYTVERQVTNTARALEARGLTTPAPQPTSSSVYVMSGGHKIAVVRTEAKEGGGVVHSAFLLAIFGDEVRRVACVSAEQQVSITFGPCADKVEETFGFRI